MENSSRIQKTDKKSDTEKTEIIFDSVKMGNDPGNNLFFLIFRNLKTGNIVEIPVERKIADHIMIYIRKIASPRPKLVERGNDEDLL